MIKYAYLRGVSAQVQAKVHFAPLSKGVCHVARLVLVGDPVPISGTRISEGDMKTYFFDCKEEDLKWLEEQLTELCKKLSEFAETKVGLRVRRHHDRVEVSGDAGLIKALKDTKLPIGLMRRATTFKHRRQPESDAPQ